MPDFLDILAQDALKTIESGYYDEIDCTTISDPQSLTQALRQAKGNPIIAEVKRASPSKGYMRKKINPVKLADSMIRAGAAGLSVITEPKHFKGSIRYLKKISEAHTCPLLMKDFIINNIQLQTAKRIGASAVLLISTLFSRGYSKTGLTEMINQAHKEGLEVLLETHSNKEFNNGITTEADLIGINNRNLKSLKTDLSVTERVLRTSNKTDKMIVSESGIKKAKDIRYLRECGVDAFLVGSSIIESRFPESKVRELVEA